jgi:hypothetical protein
MVYEYLKAFLPTHALFFEQVVFNIVDQSAVDAHADLMGRLAQKIER